MALTYTLIASNTLTSSAASVTFSSIPGTYTDLVLRISARSLDAGVDEALQVTFNSDSGTNYSRTYVRGSGSAVASFRNNDQTLLQLSQAIVGNGSTASTFGNMEIYIPNYQSSSNKPISVTTVSENNATTAFITAQAGLWRNSAAITSIVLAADGNNFVSGSSFFLYGISNT